MYRMVYLFSKYIYKYGSKDGKLKKKKTIIIQKKIKNKNKNI